MNNKDTSIRPRKIVTGICSELPALVFGSNQSTATEERWVKMASYGDYSHQHGLQRFDRASADALVRQFNSLRGRLARRFAGVPVFIGHPDDPTFVNRAGHHDTRAYGWIQDIQSGQDGLWILPRWSDAGREILANCFYKFLSPRWAMKRLADNTYTPIRLISVGLTNHPNIPGDAIANQDTNFQSINETSINERKTMLNKIFKKLGLPVDAQEQDIIQKIDSAVAGNDTASPDCDNDEAETLATNELESLRSEADRFYRLATEAEEALQDADKIKSELSSAFNNEREARIGMILDDAIRQALISPAELEKWKNDLRSNFDNALETLANSEPALNTVSRTETLGMRKQAVDRQRLFLDVVNERIAATGEDFSTAWTQSKKTRRELFDQMCQPLSEY